MKKEIIGIYEGAVGLMLVVSLFGMLTEFVILFGGMLAIPSLVRILHGRKAQKMEKTSDEAI